YIAGTDSEHFYDIALDSNNDVWVCGHTDSNDFPVVDSFQEYNGHDSSVIFELSSNGSSLLFSSIFGGAVYDRCSSLAIDERDNVYIAGSTYSSEFPLYHAEDSLSGKYYDCFVMKIGPEKTIQYSTRIGGSSNDWGNSLALGRNGAVFVGGDSQSDDFPLRREISEPSDDISTHNNGIAFILFDLSDEDGDQYPSWWELINGFDPLNPEVSFNELLTWCAPVIPTVIATSVLLVTLLVLLLSRHRIKSWFERKSSTLAVSQTK
ncbi:MAG: SBBP repeat-containing protein, partial [Candidatus Thorarchaeota archaeon]|nr:SBBP repeat-containing protein [Candidatus Thorarchaeota archaeon]